MRFLLFPALLFVLFFTSCKIQNAVTVNYLQRIDTSQKAFITLAEPRVHKNDLLSIKVYSLSADPRTDIPYNLPEQTTGSAGFLVDDRGNIEFPRLGTLHVEGMTKTQLAQEIRTRLEDVLKSPSVIVRFLNYRITVLGEVRTPGTFAVPTERITILEALGMAGDITDYGNKNIVRIAREKEGQIDYGYVDLTTEKLFNSPYFRLQQNDVVFVEQNRRKIQQQERSEFGQQLGLATSVITAILLVLSIIR